MPPPGDRESALLTRLANILGEDFRANALLIEAARENFRLDGYAGLPTWHKANAQAQYLFVNGRPVRDKLLIGAVRAAYMDYLPPGRHPALVLFLNCEPREVDVNVHPAKAEVRFRDSGLIRGLIIGALKQSLQAALHRATPAHGAAALELFRTAAKFCEPGSRSARGRLGLAAISRLSGVFRERPGSLRRSCAHRRSDHRRHQCSCAGARARRY